MMNHTHSIRLAAICSVILAQSLVSDDGGASNKKVPPTAPQSDPWVMCDGKLRWSAQERLRWEIRDNNFDFNSAVNSVTDDDFILQRFRLGLTAQPFDCMTLMFEGQDSREFGSKRPNVPGILGAEGDDEFDLRQAWIQLGDKKEFPTSLKVGRMTWNYGDQRLIGESDWNNFGRTFDAAVAHTEMDNLWFDAFFGSPVTVQPSNLNPNDGHDRVAGVCFSTKDWLDQVTQFYTIYRNHSNNVNNGPAQETWTPGVRFQSLAEACGNWDYELELAGQAGKVNSQTFPNRSLDHYAAASHIQGGYTWSELSWKPRVGGLYDFASGNANPNGSDDTGFQNLFPTNHKFYGQMDLVSWRNIHDGALNLSAMPHPQLQTKVDLHTFWLAETSDAWYRANGFTTVRSAAAGRDVDGHLGEEVDVTLIWKLNRFVTLGGGYSHFFTGGFAAATGASSDADFGYLQLTAGF